jgi:hypothetical protein
MLRPVFNKSPEPNASVSLEAGANEPVTQCRAAQTAPSPASQARIIQAFSGCCGARCPSLRQAC